VIAEAIGRFPPETTVLLIAHRPELVRHADRIVAIAEGRAVTPTESMAV